MGGLGKLGLATGAAALAIPAFASVAEAQQSTTTTAGGPTTSAAPTTTTTLPPKNPQPTDLAILSFSQTIELAMVQIYTQAVATGRLGASAAKTAAAFQGHHRQHAQSYAGMSGKATVSVANQSLITAYTTLLQAATSEQDVLKILLDLEDAAAATYTANLGVIIGTDPAALIGSVQPIEARHAVVIGEALGAATTTYAPVLEPTAGQLTVANYPIVGA
jgi:hypothetical protein